MTQFDLTSDQRQLFEHADRIGKEKLLPLAERMDNEVQELRLVCGTWQFRIFGRHCPGKYGGAD